MTKLENNINNLCVENMGIYGCKHAVKRACLDWKSTYDRQIKEEC